MAERTILVRFSGYTRERRAARVSGCRAELLKRISSAKCRSLCQFFSPRGALTIIIKEPEKRWRWIRIASVGTAPGRQVHLALQSLLPE
jgi:hypothetical protein